MIKTVIKRDGRQEPFYPKKCNDWIKWASSDIQEHVDWASVVLKTVRSLPEEVTAKQLQDAMIRTCLDMNSYGYNKMAGRLYSQALKKEIFAWNKREYPHIKDLHERMIKAGVIVKPNYTGEDYDAINAILEHSLDMKAAHYSLNQIVEKYAIKNKETKTAFETPQYTIMRVCMEALNDYKESDRLEKLKELYFFISHKKINVPTPMYANALTKNKSGASCALVKAEDTASSIGIVNTLGYSLTTSGAGLGLNINCRSIGAPVRGGVIRHSGKVPYYKMFGATIKSSMQGSRGGSATVYYPFTDPELFDLLILKNPLTVTAKRLRELDYGVIVNKWLFQRAAKKQDIYLFDSSDAPDLYEAIYTDTPEVFEEKMMKFASENPDKVKAVPALDVLKAIMKERMETGRVYLFFADEANHHTSYKDVMYSSNLCITGDQWVVTDKGIFRTKELNAANKALTLFDGEKAVAASPMRLRSASQPVMKLTFSNGATHKVTYEHKIKTPNGMFMAMDLSVGDFVCVQHKEGLFGDKIMSEEDIASWVSYNKYKGIPEALKQGTKETQETFIALVEQYAVTENERIIHGIEDFYHAVKANLGHYKDQFTRIVSIEYVGTEPVYCPTTESEEHIFTCNGIITGNCNETINPTKGYKSYADLYRTDDGDDLGYVGFCNLSGVVADNITSDEEYAKAAYYALFLIDSFVENTVLEFPHLTKSIKAWRSAGVGVLGLAHLMARNKLSYSSQEGKDFIHELMETHVYHLHEAALQLAKERGNCEYIHRSKYPEGWLPIDTYNKNVDELVTVGLKRDWEDLRKRMIEQGGLRFTSLCLIPPAETSSQVCETVNAVYPIREGSIVKVSGDVTNNWVAPEYETLKDYYDIAWEVPTKDMIHCYAIMQKFIDMGISCDFWIDRSKNRDVSTKQLIQELFWCNKYGLKGNYYYNTKMDADVVAGAIASTTFEEKSSEEPQEQQTDEPGCGSGGCTL